MATPAAILLAAPAPSTPLGPFEDSYVAWASWVTLMGFVGLVALSLFAAGPVARRIGGTAIASVTIRLAQAAVIFGVLAVPAVLTDIAHDASDAGGFDYSGAWDALYDGTNDGRLLGLEVTLTVVGVLLVLPLAVRSPASSGARNWLLSSSFLAGAVALSTTKFPTKTPADWGRTSFETLMWVLHLVGAAVWLGGLVGLLVLLAPGTVAVVDRPAFWGATIRRFSLAAMTCVAAIGLSGLWLYWEHVDGLSQLVTTMYGRVLGVKILLFGSLLLLGMANQFWLHPRIEALRSSGDERPLRTILLQQFRVAVALEVLIVLTVLMAAPFLHGSARKQAFAADAAKHATTSSGKAPTLPAKQVSASTWVYGTAETLLVIAVVVGGYRVSGRVAAARSRSSVDSNGVGPDPELAQV